MTRIILSSFAVVAMLAASATPAVSQAKLGSQQPVPEEKPKYWLTPDYKITIDNDYLKPTWERHLSSGAPNPPPPDCPRLYPIATCLASWE